MRSIALIIKKEIIQLRRDRRMMPILFLSPIIQLLLLGYAANLDVRDIPTAVCDLDRSAASRAFAARVLQSGYFALQAEVGRAADLDPLFESGRAAMGFVLPRGFGEDLEAGRPVRVQLIVDGAESQAAVIGMSYAAQIAARYSRNLLLETLDRRGFPGLRPAGVEPKLRIWYNPELKSRNFFVPGVLALVLMVMTMMLTSMGVVRERELGTLEQLLVTPIRPWQLIVGKLLPFVGVGLIDAVLVVGVAGLWFHVPVRGSVFLLLGLCLVFMLTTLGLGLFISTVSRNQQQAMLTAVFFMIPMILLSGFVFPIENMPPPIRALTTVVPLRYFFVIVRGIFLKGNGFGLLWDEAAALLVFGIVILGTSVLRFRKRLE